MAKESQGFQITLIAFVVLTILLGVTTFVFRQQYKEASLRADTSEQNARTEQTKAKSILEECNQLKEIVGFAPTDGLDKIRAEFQKDMETYAANFEEENRVYRKVLAYLNDTLQKKNADLAAEQEHVKKLEADMATFEAVKQPQIEKSLAEAAEASNRLAAAQTAFDTELKATKAGKEELLASLQESKKELLTTSEQAKVKQKELEDANRNLQQQSGHYREQVEKMITPVFEVAHGEVRWVDQRKATLWINLGRADGLKRQTTFSVYSSDTNDVTKAGRKGSIEVTEILGDHMAEARVIEDQSANPIMPGDVIHTPVWAPGQREHFALTGFLDIDGDGKSDRQLVRNLITSNGAVVDEEVDEKGARTGKMTTDTHYLVVGGSPDVNATPEVQRAYTEMLREGDKLGVRKMSLEELLRRMGYKDENRVVRFGKGADPKDFRPRLPEGQAPRAFQGDVSGLYEEKNGPRATRGTAY